MKDSIIAIKQRRDLTSLEKAFYPAVVKVLGNLSQKASVGFINGHDSWMLKIVISCLIIIDFLLDATCRNHGHELHNCVCSYYILIVNQLI